MADDCLYLDTVLRYKMFSGESEKKFFPEGVSVFLPKFARVKKRDEKAACDMIIIYF